MDNLETTVARIETKLDNVLARGDDHEERLRRLEGVGGKRWNNLVSQIITIATATACGIILGKYS